ncbi:hypothetical protein E4O05_01155 [Treponema sp. OMZ 787]|uniref:hypothetical protein n=1 Tax=Treponema sp. OMZ 787 TaxID=2563669 RepID=UPI0020A38436|nr:hypothetical protein [Treponema sp. OMZ 787]UTC62552.1 hypothetical protein E4O05_01155 [Treponema sp. OMZ 787]
MIFIGKKLLFISLAVSFIFILATAFWAFFVGMRVPLKGDSELVLFLGFILSLLQLIIIINIIIGAVKKKKDFLSLMETIKTGGILSEKKVAKLGSAGFALKDALEAASTITSQKSVKIAGLNGLMRSLISMIDIPLVVINLNGEIIDASQKIKAEKNYNKDLNISDLIPQVNIRQAFKEASVSHLPVEQGDNILVPVFSTLGDITYFLVDTSKSGALSKFINTFIPPKKEESAKQTKKRFFKILNSKK